MINISQVVQEIINRDDLVLAIAGRGLLNISAYAREIQPEIETILIKNVKEGSIVAAINRNIKDLPGNEIPSGNILQSISVHSNLEGISYERTDKISQIIREAYNQVEVSNKTYLTVTQGINEITIVAEKKVANKFKEALKNFKEIYDKSNLVGITVKFDLKFLAIPNLIYALSRRLALKSINIIEIISTASELTFIIDRADLRITLEQLQKNI